ncbi:group III truncated hemoglobin [Pseudorhodobacter sp.]|uniref:group III truncated hemoglobin n=1 Tax=Pseudorhodobacter sp. TaxID=1934400 RepID=UPI002649B5EA|nr:group III truncated hemoglobin [Pseudorhodobacter sp.]MDN5786171.1 group III truncated hemoglobin [Pseudorhodobacter sp.]
MMLARFPISPDQIDCVVARFYARIRQHPVLGPIFAAHVTDWPEHEAKIARFWRNAILMERSYDGNPMMKHMQAGNVRGPMFVDWLALFDEVLDAELPPETALAWSTLAHRIGRGLRMGVEDLRAMPEAPPTLR